MSSDRSSVLAKRDAFADEAPAEQPLPVGQAAEHDRGLRAGLGWPRRRMSRVAITLLHR